MAGAMSNYLRTALLNAVLKNTSYTSPPVVYLGLFTSATDADSGGTEVTGNAYQRQSVAFGAITTPNETLKNSGTVTFPTATPAQWGTVTDFGIYDSQSGGNRLFWGTLDTQKLVGAGDIIQFIANAIAVSLS